MTMPHLMNCTHQGKGWCLDCVKALHDEKERMAEALTLIAQAAHYPADSNPDLAGQPDRYEKLVERLGQMAHDALRGV